MDIASILISAVLGALGGFFLSYFNEKRKDFAAKEDVGKVTEEQAKVHLQYDAQLETLRSQLDRQTCINKLTFEKEFEILSKLWDGFVDFRDATSDDTTRLPISSQELPQRHLKQLKNLEAKHLAFIDIFERNRPFYPQEIYEIVLDFILRTRLKSILSAQYAQAKPEIHAEVLEKTTKEIYDLNEKLSNAIRKRLQPDTI